MIRREPTPAQSILQLSLGFISARAIYVAARLGIADLMRDGPTSAGELAEKVSVDADALFRIMRLLAGVGVLKQSETNRFSLTGLGETLRTDSPQSVTDYVILYHEAIYPVFSNIMHRMRTGESALLKTFGKSVFDMTRSDPEFAAMFHMGLASRAKGDIAALIEAYDFSEAGKIADIGGGAGALLSAILSRHPNLSGILFDIAPAIESAKSGSGGPLPRCEFVVGDFFEQVPGGADIYLLKLVLHDWGDDDVKRILTRCREAMRPKSRLLIIEGLIGPPNELTMTNLVDMTMLLAGENRERTETEFAALLERTGLKLQRAIPTNSSLHILEATIA
jgi:O-methyltransferase domain/Dimerisation domain